MNKFFQWTLGIIGTVLLGALGSGLWELFLADALVFIGKGILSILSSLSSTYLDSLYKNIWKGSDYSYLHEIYVLTFVTYLMMPILIIRSNRVRGNQRKEGDDSKTPKSKYFKLLVLLSALAITLTLKVWETSFSVEKATKFRANIEILKADITVQEYDQLCALLYQVTDRQSALKLNERIDKYAHKHGVVLHDIDLM
ncbi:hypothetical protein ACP6IB_26525 [Vibrio harveyi]|uniref:hypothetical protein n=1 Tax=Vibrio harveyi TaxID=669 RepID=UPI003735A731